MNDRKKILDTLRESKSPGKKTDRPSLPLDAMRTVSPGTSPERLLALFAERFIEVGGEILPTVSEENFPVSVEDFIKRENIPNAIVDDELFERLSQIECAEWIRASDADKETAFAVELGITIVQQAVAETGGMSIFYGQGRARLTSLAPPLHLAIVPIDRIVADLIDAVDDFGEGSGTVWITGPSKTADIGGILVRGIHGPGRIIVLPVG